MKGKRIFYSELSYLLGIVILTLGNTLMERASFGLSMVVAPAYLLHLKISTFLPFFTFGMAGYTLQVFLLIGLSIVMKKVKKGYFLSFLTAVLYGFVLDAWMSVIALIPFTGTVARLLFFVFGLAITAFGVSLLFHTYFPPEAYDLIVKELAGKFGVLYAAVEKTADSKGVIHIISNANYAAQLNAVLSAMSYPMFGKGKAEESPKKEKPRSPPEKSSGEHATGCSVQKKENKPSVREHLEKLRETAKVRDKPQKTREKQR